MSNNLPVAGSSLLARYRFLRKFGPISGFFHGRSHGAALAMGLIIMNHSLRISSAFYLLVASASFFACGGVDDPTGSNTGAIQGSGAACQVDSDCPFTTEECDDNVCKLHGTDDAGDDNGVDAAGHDAGDDNGVDAAGHDAGDDNGVDAAGHDAGDDNGVDAAGHDAGDDNGGGGGAEPGDDNGADA